VVKEKKKKGKKVKMMEESLMQNGPGKKLSVVMSKKINYSALDSLFEDLTEDS